jgi:hypothetical protein
VSKTAWPQGDIFSDSLPGQVAELLAADGEQRPEDHDLLVLATLHHRLEAGAQRQRGLAGAGPAAEGDDADLGVEQQVERDPLLGGAAVHAERLAVAAHQVHLLVRPTRAQRVPALGEQHQTGVAGQVARLGEVEHAVVVQLVEVGRGDLELGHAGPAGVGLVIASARYSSASRPTADALIRSGRSLETRRDVGPSSARLRATARIRVSLSPSRKPDGSDSGSVWLSSTRSVPPTSPTGTGSSSRPC